MLTESAHNSASRPSLVAEYAEKVNKGTGPEAVRALEWVLLLHDLGVPLEATVAIATETPALLQAPAQELAATCAFLADSGLLCDKLWRPPVLNQLLTCQLESQLKPTVFHLLSLGMPSQDICTLLCRYPAFPRYSILRKQRPLVERLQTTYGVSLEGVRTILLRHPKLVTTGFPKMSEVDELLRAELGIQAQDAGTCLVRFPGLLSLSTDRNLQPTIRHLLGLGLTREEVAKMVVSVPALLSLDFQPGGKQWLKWRFFLQVMGKSPRDLLTFPRYFTCSLEKRIAPRTLFILQNGLDPAPIALQKVMALTDQSFAERTAGRPHDDFLLFLDTWEQLPAWQEWQQAAQSAAILAAAAAATAAQRLDDDGTDDRVHSSNKDAR